MIRLFEKKKKRKQKQKKKEIKKGKKDTVTNPSKFRMKTSISLTLQFGLFIPRSRNPITFAWFASNVRPVEK